MADVGGMRYFLLTDNGRNPFPEIKGWSQVLDVRKLNRREYRELPSFFQLDMRLGMDWVLPDVLLFPFLLLSEQAKDIVSFYDSDIPWCFVTLFDDGKEPSRNYLYILTICVMLYVIYGLRGFWRAFIWHIITIESQVL